MTPQELKNSILQLAIQGKLVEQRPEECTAEELYTQIQAEKQALIKAGKIKREKPLPEIAEDEKPFDIPDSWKWVQIGSLFEFINGDRGKNYPSKDKLSSSGEIPFISAVNMQHHTVPTDGLLYVSQKQYDALGNGKLKKGDFVVCIRGSLGKCCVYPFEKGAIASSLVILRQYGHVVTEYFMYYLESLLFFSEIRKYNNGTAQPNLSAKDAMKFLMPLPPLNEQKRIVAKIEELLPLIDRYEAAWSRLEEFSKRFPGDMQKSLLQMAIQGKLVEQRPEEGTGDELYQQIQAEKQVLIKSGKIKKDKPLPEITDGEKPFDIPESWKWVRLSEVGTTQTGNTPKKAFPEYFGTFIPFLGPGDIQNGVVNYGNQGLSESGMQVGRVADKNSILQVCIGGSIGKCALVDRRVAFNQQINAITPIFADEKFVYYILNSAYFTEFMKEHSGGTATPIINRGLWDAIVIPLPPLAEQKRIVAKLEELLPLCERLK